MPTEEPSPAPREPSALTKADGNRQSVLSLCYEYPPVGGGGAKVAQLLAEGLTRAGWWIDFLTMAFGNLSRTEARPRLRLFRFSCWRKNLSVCHFHEMLLFLARVVPEAVRRAKSSRYAFVHAHFIFPDGVTALCLKWWRGHRYIITVHGSDVPGYNPDRFTLWHRVLQPAWKTIVANADFVVCPSAFLERLVRNHAPRAKTTVIPNGIDSGRFDARRKRCKRILVVTRMFKRKGVQHLLRALHGLEHDYEVCVVGDGPYLDTLKQLAADLGLEVRFTGFIEHKSAAFVELFETSEIFVFTSEAENCPMVLLEAMSCGLAIITSDDTGCGEAVGDAALAVKATDPQAIRDALCRLVNDPALRTELGRAARRRVETHFDHDIILDRYERLYTRCSEPPEAKCAPTRPS